MCYFARKDGIPEHMRLILRSALMMAAVLVPFGAGSWVASVRAAAVAGFLVPGGDLSRVGAAPG